MTEPTRQQKITLGAMRAAGVRGLPVYCADFKCAHLAKISAAGWPDHVRLSDLEPLFYCRFAANGAPTSGRTLIGIKHPRHPRPLRRASG
jgi:hypothetical protein